MIYFGRLNASNQEIKWVRELDIKGPVQNSNCPARKEFKNIQASAQLKCFCVEHTTSMRCSSMTIDSAQIDYGGILGLLDTCCNVAGSFYLVLSFLLLCIAREDEQYPFSLKWLPLWSNICFPADAAMIKSILAPLRLSNFDRRLQFRIGRGNTLPQWILWAVMVYCWPLFRLWAIVLLACDLLNEGEESRNRGADNNNIHFTADQKRTLVTQAAKGWNIVLTLTIEWLLLMSLSLSMFCSHFVNCD